MRILFDHNVSKKLRRDLLPHQVVLTKEKGWQKLANGALLAEAQTEFDVLLTMDANLYHQQNVAQYTLAVIVLRAYDNDYQSVSPLLPEFLELLERAKPGEIYYAYVGEKLQESDRHRGKGPYAKRG
jgi:predicted nuclease of predicted toxin-antitoxin system